MGKAALGLVTRRISSEETTCSHSGQSEIPLGVLAFQQPPVLEEDLDRDCVGSLKHRPRTHPARAEGRLVYNGADRDSENGNPGSRMPGWNGSLAAPRSGCASTIFRAMRLAR